MSTERKIETSQIKLLCRIVAPAENRDEVLRTFRSLVGPVSGTVGCRGCQLLEDVQRRGQLQFSEEWAHPEDFARHVRSDLFRRVLVALELAAEPPEVEIETISGQRGMDLIFELRGEVADPLSRSTVES